MRNFYQIKKNILAIHLEKLEKNRIMSEVRLLEMGCMIFNEWQARVEELTDLRGHGSRKKIAEMLGLTSETIKSAEKAGEASIKMMKALLSFEDDLREKQFEPLMGQSGRWNVGDAIGGVLVTHIQQPFAFTAGFLWPDEEQGETWHNMRVRVIAYDKMSQDQLADLVDEAREVAARRMRLTE